MDVSSKKYQYKFNWIGVLISTSKRETYRSLNEGLKFNQDEHDNEK